MPNRPSLEDVSEMTQLCFKYARALDTHEFELLREVYTTDVLLQYHGMPTSEEAARFAGMESILAFLSHLGSLRTQHVMTNHEFEADGDQVKGWSYALAQHWRT